MRSLAFAAVFGVPFAIPLGMGEQGVWWGLVAGEILGGLLAFVWARMYLSQLDRLTGEETPLQKGEPETT